MKDIYAVLDGLGITYVRHDHAPFYTMADAAGQDETLPGAKAKSLLLRGKSGAFYLVVIEGKKRLDTKALAALLREGKLSFASAEELLALMGIAPGSVSPFGLINDEGKKISLVIDAEVWNERLLNFHPNTNTATLSLSRSDFEKFLSATGRTWQIASL